MISLKMGEPEDLIDKEIKEIIYQRDKTKRTQIEDAVAHHRRELELQSSTKLEEFKLALERNVDSLVQRRRISLEKALEKEQAISFEKIRRDFASGYNDGWQRVSRGENLSPSIILTFLPLGINMGDAAKFGLALGCLAGTIETQPALLFNNPKSYIGAMDILRRPEYKGYRDFVLAKIKKITTSGLTDQQIENYNYFIKKVF